MQLEEGAYSWGPGDQTVAGSAPAAKDDNTVHNGRFMRVSGAAARRMTLAGLPSSSVRIAFDAGMYSSTDAVSVCVACSPVTDRSDTGTTSAYARFSGSRANGIYSQASGTGTQIGGNVYFATNEGHVTVTYDATTGEVATYWDGELMQTQVYAGAPFPKIGLAVQGDAWIDNFEVGPL